QAVLTKTGWLSHKLLATGTFGKLHASTYGWYGEVQWDGQKDRVGLVGYSVASGLRSFENNQNHAFGYYEREWGDMGLTARLGYGRFVNDYSDAALLSLRRRFGESTVAAEAMRSRDGEEAINFQISVPMGPRVAGASSALRLRSARAFKIGYHSNLGLKGDYLQNGQDLASFRGEPTAPYVARHAERLLGEGGQPLVADWPSSPSLEGTTGLIRIPTAEVAGDGTLQGGITYMDRDHSRLAGAPSDAMPMFVSIGLLPNLELVGKLTIFHDTRMFAWPFNTDRSFNVHYRLCKQGPHHPAIAIGAQDISFAAETQEIGKSEYIVSTWAANRWRAHAGLGKDRLEGAFGGVNVDLTGNRKLQLLMDYDTEFVNAGLRGFVGKWLTLDASLLGMSKLGGAVVFRTELK
ncbi:MAG: YjbH domain-containing protein, partial [Armatimonadota bacterium]